MASETSGMGVLPPFGNEQGAVQDRAYREAIEAGAERRHFEDDEVVGLLQILQQKFCLIEGGNVLGGVVLEIARDRQ